MTAASNSEARKRQQARETTTDLPDVFFALDGDDEPTLWLRRPLHPSAPKALIRKCDVGTTAWSVVVVAIEAAQTTQPPATATNEGAVGAEVVGRLTEAQRAKDWAAEWSDQVGRQLMFAMTCTHDGDEFGTRAVCETCFANVQRLGEVLRAHAEQAWDGAVASAHLHETEHWMGIKHAPNPYRDARQEPTHD